MFIVPVSTPMGEMPASLTKVSMELVMSRDELCPIVLGSNLPRAEWETPLMDVADQEVQEIATVAIRLTAAYQDLDSRVGSQDIRAGAAQEHRIPLPVAYKQQTLDMLGTWSLRYLEREKEDTDPRVSSMASWVVFRSAAVATDQRAARLTTMRILAADRRFWNLNRVQ